MHSEICPVCKGSGQYKGKKCHGCDGKGWVALSDEGINKEYVPVPYETQPYRPYIPWESEPTPVSPWVAPWEPWKYKVTYRTGTGVELPIDDIIITR